MHPSQEFLRFQSYISCALKPRQLLGDLAEIALRQFEFDSAKVLIEAMQSSLVALGGSARSTASARAARPMPR